MDHADSGGDLRRIGIEVPQQLGALFLMDGEDINQITRDVAPLTDNYPKRLSDAPWDEEASHRFALTYMETLPVFQRFLHSSLVGAIWPESLNTFARIVLRRPGNALSLRDDRKQ